jgi:hypothetical protein
LSREGDGEEPWLQLSTSRSKGYGKLWGDMERKGERDAYFKEFECARLLNINRYGEKGRKYLGWLYMHTGQVQDKFWEN